MSELGRIQYAALRASLKQMSGVINCGLSTMVRHAPELENSLARVARSRFPDQAFYFALREGAWSGDGDGMVIGPSLLETSDAATSRWEGAKYFCSYYDAHLAGGRAPTTSPKRTSNPPPTIGVQEPRGPDVVAMLTCATPCVERVRYWVPSMGDWFTVNRRHILDSGFSGSIVLPFGFVELGGPLQSVFQAVGVRQLRVTGGAKLRTALFEGAIEWPPDSGRQRRIVADVPIPLEADVDTVDIEEWLFEQMRLEPSIGSELLWPGSLVIRRPPADAPGSALSHVYVWSELLRQPSRPAPSPRSQVHAEETNSEVLTFEDTVLVDPTREYPNFDLED